MTSLYADKICPKYQSFYIKIEYERERKSLGLLCFYFSLKDGYESLRVLAVTEPHVKLRLILRYINTAKGFRFFGASSCQLINIPVLSHSLVNKKRSLNEMDPFITYTHAIAISFIILNFMTPIKHLLLCL